MEAIKAIAKKQHAENIKLIFFIDNNADETEVMVIINKPLINSNKTETDFAGKMECKKDPIAYKKCLEINGTKIILDTNV